MSSLGRSIRLFLVDGDPSGVITAEVVNWTGHVLHAPRVKLAEVIARSEGSKTGVYFLFGDLQELGGKRPVYIGESDNVGKRILQHSRNEDKEFERFCVITSKDLNLTKAHARFLENRFSSIAKESGRADVLNIMEPAIGVLPESDIADMNYFIEQVRLILPVLGYEILKEKFSVPSQAGSNVSVPLALDEEEIVPLHLRTSKKGLRAEAFEKAGEIVVKAGSLADRFPEHSVNQYQQLRDRLIADGVLVPQNDGPFLRFTQDALFASPSAAAAVIYGRNANGRTSWMIAGTSRTLKEHQDSREALEAAE